MSGISFDLPLYSAEIYHSDYPKTNPWTRVFNFVETQGQSEEESEIAKVEAAVKLFIDDGLDKITIQSIIIAPLQTLEGGDNA